MKTTLPIACHALMLVLSLGAASLEARADLINVDFGRGANPNTSIGAGVYGGSDQTWNVFNSPYSATPPYTYNYSTGDLFDASGDSTGVTIAFSGDGSNLPNYGSTAYSGDSETFEPTLFGNLISSSNESVDFSGLAAGAYNLIVYSDNSSSSDAQDMDITFDVNGVSETLENQQDNSGFSTGPGNYLSVDVVVTSNGELNIANLDTGGPDLGVSGLQIEAIPEPSVLSMAAGGGLILLFVFRRKLAATA